MTDVSVKPDLASTRYPRRLRVLVFTSVFPNPKQPLHGTFVFERIRHLADLADVEVLVPVPWYRTLRPDVAGATAANRLAVTHVRFWYPPKVLHFARGALMAMSAARNVRRLHRKFDFDLIDAHFAYPDGFAAVLLGRWLHRPVCITLRGTEIPQSRTRIGRWLCDWAINRADRVIAVAEILAERARQAGATRDRIKTIPNGVDGARFQPIDRGTARRGLAIPEQGCLLVAVGHFSPRKGFQHVIRSLPRVIESVPDLRLAIVGGKGAERDNSTDLQASVRACNLSDRVLFVGAQPPDRVALWLSAADLFVHASNFEGCPNVIMEAMACGRPVVATKVGDVAGMVPPFAGILLDDPEDDVSLAHAILAALGRNWDERGIRDYVAMRSWDAVAREVEIQWRLAVDSFTGRPFNGSVDPVNDADLVAITSSNR